MKKESASRLYDHDVSSDCLTIKTKQIKLLLSLNRRLIALEQMT